MSQGINIILHYNVRPRQVVVLRELVQWLCSHGILIRNYNNLAARNIVFKNITKSFCCPNLTYRRKISHREKYKMLF